MTIKQRILEVIQNLPDDETIELGIEELCALAGVSEGLVDIEASRTIPHERVLSHLLRRSAKSYAL